MLKAVVGINWGDEGKGRMMSFLSGVRYRHICLRIIYAILQHF